MAVGAFSPITLTIVYDNNPFDARLKTAWGFACLVETDVATVLFDTGGDGPTLMGNLAALEIDPRRIDLVILSHYHSDHTGGLDALLDVDNDKTVYVPRSFPVDFKARLAERARIVEVSEPVVITDGIRTTGEVSGTIVEQSLIVETNKGLIVVTGCAHPGIARIVEQTRSYGEVYLLVGGFHLMGSSPREVELVIAELKRLGVQKVAPCHCTGEAARRLFEAEFGADCIPAGVGAVVWNADGPFAEQ